METCRDHRVRLIACLALLAALSATGAAAESNDPPDWPDTITVHTEPDAAVVEATATEQNEGATVSTGSSGPKCHLKEPDADGDPELQHVYYAHKVPYYLVCDDGTTSIVWLDYTQPEPGQPGPAREPEDVALYLRDEIPIPQVEVRINPPRGLVGAESWFWIDGYDGRPITNSTDAFGALVEVEARVIRYEWSMGDGTTVASETPGQPYPRRSEVRHTYQRSSFGLAEGYAVRATFFFSVRYRVAGGSWIELPGIERTASADYPVRESQAVIER